MNLSIFDADAPALVQAFLLEEEGRRKVTANALRSIEQAEQCPDPVARMQLMKEARTALEEWVAHNNPRTMRANER